MIVEALVSLVAALVSAIGDLFGTVSLPGWYANLDSWLTTLGGSAAGYVPFVPWSLTLNVAAFVLVCLGLAFAIKVIRIVASFFTAGGGSAA